MIIFGDASVIKKFNAKAQRRKDTNKNFKLNSL
jgi:hypothetical protein